MGRAMDAAHTSGAVYRCGNPCMSGSGGEKVSMARLHVVSSERRTMNKDGIPTSCLVVGSPARLVRATIPRRSEGSLTYPL